MGRVMEIERELKYLISDTAYENIKILLDREVGLMKKDINFNYYFDTSDFALLCQKVSARLRCENSSKFELTVKVSTQAKSDNYHIKEEYTKELKSDEFDYLIKKSNTDCIEFFDNQQKEFLQRALNDQDIVLFKSPLCTERLAYHIQKLNLAILLDKSEYLNTTDYEVEIEVPNDVEKLKAEDYITSLFKRVHVIPYDSSESKTRRYKKQHMKVNV